MRHNTYGPWIISIMLFIFIGCGSFGSMPIEKQVVISYEVMGETLKTAKPTMIGLCASGDISAEDCVNARNAYNEAVTLYKMLGEMAIVAVDTGDGSNYQELSLQLMALLTTIQTYTGGPQF